MASLLRFFSTSLLFGLCCLAQMSYAQNPQLIRVGHEPQFIRRIASDVHVFCRGIDKNFNQKIETDSGDVAPSWYIVDASTKQIVRSRSLNYGTLPYPVRVAFTENSVYIPFGSSFRRFNIISQEEIDEPYLVPAQVGSIVALQLDGDEANGRMLMTTRTSFSAPGSLVAYSLANRRVDTTFPTGINPQQILRYGIGEYAVLNEGVFGQNNSTVQLVNIRFGLTSAEFARVDVGDTGNHLLFDGSNLTYVTVNNSHRIDIVDMLGRSVIQSIPTGTSGGGGPRESCLFELNQVPGFIAVTTFSGDVRLFNTSGLRIGTIPVDATPEAISYIGSQLWVAHAFQKGSFAADSVIGVYDIVTSVNEVAAQNLSLYPNPTTGLVNITLPALGSQTQAMEIVNSVGQVVHVQSVQADETSLRIDLASLGLNTGAYLVRFSGVFGMFASPLVLVR